MRTLLLFVMLIGWISSSGVASEPVLIAPGNSRLPPRQPQAAVSEDGTIFVTFGAGETVYCSVSQDRGQTFQSPVVVGMLKKLALGKRRGPRIAACASHAVITAISHESGDIQSWRSIDQGKTWSASTRVNDVPKSAAEGLHAMAIGPRGQLYCVWLDLRNKLTEVYGAHSTDGAATWKTNRLVYRSPSGTVCECCHPSVAFDTADRIFVMWRNSLDGNRDMYLAISRDQGQTFPETHQLGAGNWPLNACPMDGGALATSSDGTATTVWRRNQHIYKAVSGNTSEANLGVGEQPWVTATRRGACVVWVTRRGSDLWLLQPSHRQPTKVAANASDPVIAAAPDGASPLIVVWELGQGTNVSLLAKAVELE